MVIKLNQGMFPGSGPKASREQVFEIILGWLRVITYPATQ